VLEADGAWMKIFMWTTWEGCGETR